MTTPDAHGGTGTLVAASMGEDAAWLVDVETGRQIAVLPTGAEPHEVAVSPDGRRAAVADYGGRYNPGNTVTFLDLAQQSVQRTVALGTYRRPHGIAWLPDGTRVAVTCETEQAVVVIDAEAGTIESAVRTNRTGSHMLALSPDGRRAYTTDVGSGSVTVLDLEAGRAVASAPAGPQCEGFALSPDGRELWVGNRGDETISVMDAGTLRVTATLPAPGLPYRVAFTPDGKTVVVTQPRRGVLRVFDAASRAERAQVDVRLDLPDVPGPKPREPMGGSPTGLTVSADGRWVYATQSNAPVVAAVDLEAGRVAAYLLVGRGSDGVGHSPLRAG